MDLASFAPKYEEWCLLRIEEAAASGFREIEWIGDAHAMAVLNFGTGLRGVTLRDFFAALLRRRLVLNYSLSGISSKNDTIPPIDWDEYVRHMKSWNQERHSGVLNAMDFMKSSERDALKVLKALRRLATDLGWEMRPQGRKIALIESFPPNGLTVRTFFEADRRGFTYWHAIGFRGDRVPTMTESFLAWLGLRNDTVLARFDRYDSEEAARFVATKVKIFDEWVQGI